MLATPLASADNGKSLPQLIEQLGADSFRARKAAELQLKEQSRDSLAILHAAQKNTTDPEVRMRLERILSHIRSNPDTIPTTIKVFTSKERGTYKNLAQTYRESASISAQHIDGTAGTAGPFAQSFIPRTETITAVEVCTYALSDAYGWMRLDLCEDDQGKPGVILARSWIYIPKGHRFPHSEYAFHDFADQKVDPETTYWLTYIDINLPKRSNNLINYGLSTKSDAYPDGVHWRGYSNQPKPNEDLKFRIFNTSPNAHPGYRDPTKAEVDSRPTRQEQEQLESKLKWKTTSK